jgi:hypothetical protein
VNADEYELGDRLPAVAADMKLISALGLSSEEKASLRLLLML